MPKLFENHTIFNKNWTEFFNKVFMMIIAMVMFAFLLLSIPFWILSFGHLRLYRWFNHILGFYNDNEEPQIIISGLGNVKIIDNDGLITKSWLRVMRGILLFISLFPIMILYIPTGLIWLLSLGHLYLYRILTKYFEWASNLIFPDTDTDE